MTNSMTTNEYAEFLAKEYLLDYVRTGGATVKFCVGTPGALVRIPSPAAINSRRQQLLVRRHRRSRNQGLDDRPPPVRLDPDARRAELRPETGRGGVPSRRVSSRRRRAISPSPLPRITIRWTRESSIEAFAAGSSTRCSADRSRPRDLRLALFRMAQYALAAGDINEAEAEAVAEWLAGRPARTAALRSSGIRYRITRANAHPILAAILSGVGPSHRRGLVVSVDLAPWALTGPRQVRRGTITRRRRGLTPTRCSESSSTVPTRSITVLCSISIPSQLFDDPQRGPFAYPALAMRLFEDVTDRQLPNPFSPVIRIAEAQEDMMNSSRPTSLFDIMAARQAIEAFRSGVPSSAAITALDCSAT